MCGKHPRSGRRRTFHLDQRALPAADLGDGDGDGYSFILTKLEPDNVESTHTGARQSRPAGCVTTGTSGQPQKLPVAGKASSTMSFRGSMPDNSTASPAALPVLPPWRVAVNSVSAPRAPDTDLFL